MASSTALTDAEQAVMAATADLFNAFVALGDHHPADIEEMTRDIHDIQHRIMARLTRRAYPRAFVSGDTATGLHGYIEHADGKRESF